MTITVTFELNNNNYDIGGNHKRANNNDYNLQHSPIQFSRSPIRSSGQMPTTETQSDGNICHPPYTTQRRQYRNDSLTISDSYDNNVNIYVLSDCNDLHVRPVPDYSGGVCVYPIRTLGPFVFIAILLLGKRTELTVQKKKKTVLILQKTN